MLMLGGPYQGGKIGEEPDYDKAKKWCEKAMKAVKRLRVHSKNIDNDALEGGGINVSRGVDKEHKSYHKKNSM